MSQPTQCAYIGAGEGTLRSPRPLAARRVLPALPVRVRLVAGRQHRVAVVEHGTGAAALVRRTATLREPARFCSRAPVPGPASRPCAGRRRCRGRSYRAGCSPSRRVRYLPPSVRRAMMAIHGVRCGIRQLRMTALLPKGFHEHRRVAMTNSVCNYGQDSTRPPGPATGQVRECSHESFRQAPRRTRDAHLNRRARAGRAERSSRRRRSERRRVLPLAASNGGARHREPVAVRRRGRSVCCGGPGRQWDAACGVDRTRSRHRDRCNDNPPPERG